MSSHQEIHSFVSKFLNLLHCGKSAKLVLECHEGQAHVDLHHILTFLPQEPRSYNQPHSDTGRRHQQGPSRQRRRARRAVARASTNAAKASSTKAETATQYSDVAVQTAVNRAEKASQHCPDNHLQEQAAQADHPSHHERAGQACLAPHFPVDRTVPSDDLRTTPLAPVRDVFCSDHEYSAGQAVPQLNVIPQVDGCIDLSPPPLPTVSCVSAAGIQQCLQNSWPVRDKDREEEERKKEREKDLEFIKNLVRKM